ncbi:hypothetical protein DPEC_G00262670 [Dallia pectoralis]|uniref:Uncharacterized protein n=1 Tax=Dallia pectoralis TaxID=75939 RepID=A0ACC2FSC8_DALPE|nr:hypothetical protein DPEC_G00262670 [Dallia pectoralis]
MENNHHKNNGEKHPRHWTSCKLITDPALKNGCQQVYRYDGQHFNMPVKDLGLFPVDTVRDPRIFHIWTKFRHIDLLVPKFKIDECYVGPPKEVTFARLNDNVRESFLTDMCKKYGQIEEVEILYNPKNKKHLGLAKVIFDTVKAAKDTVEHLHGTSVMGNFIHVELDPKGKNRMLYFHLLVNGLYTPWTLPLGSDDTLQSLTHCFQDIKPLHRLTDECSQLTQSIFSPSSVATPHSLDTAYSSIWQDTPGSFGQTPLSQGTPRTPSFTPLSQDSCYSSLHTTPVHQIGQVENFSAYSSHRRLRWDVCYRQPGRPRVRSHHQNSELSSLLKHMQPPARLLVQSQTPVSDSGCRSSHRYPSSSGYDNPATKLSHLSDSGQASFGGSSLPLSSKAFSLSGSFAPAQSVNGAPLKERPHSPRSEPDVDILNRSPGNPVPDLGSHSLDSRIEMLLKKTSVSCPSLNGETSVDAEVPGQNSLVPPSFPVSTDSPQSERAPAPSGSPASSRRPTTRDGLEDVSPTPLPQCEGDKFITVTPPLIWTAQHHRPSEGIQTGLTNPTTDQKHMRSGHDSILSPQRLHEPREYADISDGRRSGPANSKCNGSKGTAVASSIPFLPPPPPASTPLTRPVSIPSSNPYSSHPFSNPPPPIARFNHPVRFPPPNLNPLMRFPVHGTPTPMTAPPSLVHPFYPYPMNTLHGVHLNTLNGIPAVSYPVPPWPRPPVMPAFDPSVPPPGYRPQQEHPCKATVDKVLAVVTAELKAIVKKDVSRKIIEGIAFRAFDDWWNRQEQKAKTITLVKSREGSEEVKTKPRDVLRRNTVQNGSRPLPSFKVKRKVPGDPTVSEDLQRMCPDSPVNDALDTAELEGETINCTSDRSQTNVRFPAVRRRHARPHELDSEGEEEEESREKQAKTNKDNVLTVDAGPQRKENEVDDIGEQKEEVDQYNDGGQDVVSKIPRTQSPNEEDATVSLSESESYSSIYSEYFSDSSSVSEASKDSSSDQETDGGTRVVECVVLSSDEEEMDAASPPTSPSAPLTPGTQLDLPDESEPVLRDQSWDEQHLACLNGDDLGLASRTHLLGPGMDLLRKQDFLAPSPIGLPVVETDVEVDFVGFDWSAESPDNQENLRPLTPTGSLLDSDSDRLFKCKPTPPAGEEVEVPHTPGRDAGAVLESEEDNLRHLFSPSPASSESFSQLRNTPTPASYHTYVEDRPQTPGKEECTLWNPPTPWRTTVTPGRETSFTEGVLGFSPPTCSPFLYTLSPSLYTKTPQTPGRDFMPVKKTLRKTPLIITSPQRTNAAALACNVSLTDSSVLASSPSGRSESSSDRGGVWTIPHPGHQSHREREHCSWRRVQRRRRWRWRRRMSSMQRTVPFSTLSASPGFRHRSQREETSVLHRVWRQGLDEEDAKLLEVTYDRLLQGDNGVLTANRADLSDWMRDHVTGSARSEGFYKISREDKIKYLNSACLLSDHPSAESQGARLPSQPPPTLRSGSEFRSEQRRLLSSFSCDSDLLKFNQLKFRKKKIRFGWSHIHDWGLFALEPIAADDMVIEYVGQCIRQGIADMREKRYEDEGIGSSYLFRVDQDTIIDATKCGNLARFINHSCNPNCYAKIVTVESQKKIVIYSRQPISVNEEITYDYKFPIEDDKIPCLCGAENCQGFLN